MNEHPEEKKIHTIVILFSPMNTSMLVGQIESIVKSNTHIKLLEREKTERMGLGLLVLECIGNLPEELMYELCFNTLLMDYIVYEVPPYYEDELKGGHYAERA